MSAVLNQAKVSSVLAHLEGKQWGQPEPAVAAGFKPMKSPLTTVAVSTQIEKSTHTQIHPQRMESNTC